MSSEPVLHSRTRTRRLRKPKSSVFPKHSTTSRGHSSNSKRIGPARPGWRSSGAAGARICDPDCFAGIYRAPGHAPWTPRHELFRRGPTCISSLCRSRARAGQRGHAGDPGKEFSEPTPIAPRVLMVVLDGTSRRSRIGDIRRAAPRGERRGFLGARISQPRADTPADSGAVQHRANTADSSRFPCSRSRWLCTGGRDRPPWPNPARRAVLAWLRCSAWFANDVGVRPRYLDAPGPRWLVMVPA